MLFHWQKLWMVSKVHYPTVTIVCNLFAEVHRFPMEHLCCTGLHVPYLFCIYCIYNFIFKTVVMATKKCFMVSLQITNDSLIWLLVLFSSLLIISGVKSDSPNQAPAISLNCWEYTVSCTFNTNHHQKCKLQLISVWWPEIYPDYTNPLFLA